MDEEATKLYYRHGWSKWVGPLYYDYPDGEDLVGKLSFCGQMAFLLSAPMGIMNAYIKHPYPTSHKGRFLRVLKAVGPGVGMGLTFAATTYYSTRIRQKDDALNHCFGGIAAGAIFGACKGFRNGVFATFILAPFAAICKVVGFFPKESYRRRAPNYILRKKDFATFPEKGDNWVKAPPPEN